MDLEDNRKRALAVLGLLALLALAFQGSRGLWEPDEGRYSAIALTMLRSGDWSLPRLNGEPFLDKPPLLFWSLAGGIALAGQNEWGVRLPLAIFFLAAAFAIARLGRALWDDRTGWLAAGVWGVSLMPFLAANVATPDLALSCCIAFIWLGVVRAERAATARELWSSWLLAGLAAGLGMLAKGPALFVFLPPLMLYLAGKGHLRAALHAPRAWVAALLALGLAAAWYAPVLASVPGASTYLLDNQVTGRLVTSTYHRNPGFAGAFTTYLPTLLIGALPWWPIAAMLSFGTATRRKATWQLVLAHRRDPAAWLLLSGVLVPLAIFMVASSRLPLYILPLWIPLALIFARRLSHVAVPSPRRWALLLAWASLLLAIKAAAAFAPLGGRDSRRLAQAIASSRPADSIPLIVISAQANGLPFYGFADFHWVRAGKTAYPLFAPPLLLEEALPRIAREGAPHLVLMDSRRSAELLQRLAQAGWHCTEPSRYERLAGAECAPAAHDDVAASTDEL